ncbi:MAG: beta-galactosidase [Clostridia bacterium]|nr:beta-galactosidase [Clostridia bacterium]
MIPRSEHPNPQFERENWESLNGKWEFEIDKSISGKARKLFEAEHLSGEIIVPFCPESSLSGVGETDFLNSVWYKREINIKDKIKRIILHIGACDYFTTVYVNGKEVGTHKGGYTSFEFDITDFVQIGLNTLVINAVDDCRTGLQPSGKQSPQYDSYGCYYTRTTGIWQSVWLEYVPETHIKSAKFYPDAANGKIEISALVEGKADFVAKAFYDGKEVGKATAKTFGNEARVSIELSEIHLWELGDGKLYDLELSYGDDRVKSYFGLRNVHLDGKKFMLNGKSVFQRTVLDQGFYPDGLYTAPTEEAMIADIQMGLDAGFNGARLHEKVFEPRFLYHCDRMGYMVWGEYANWGLDHTRLHALPTFLREWQEAVERDFNHPSIIGWCPFNETWDLENKKQNDEVIELVYRATKTMDKTRPCIDTSGNFHVVTDIFDYHDYLQDVTEFKEYLKKIENEDVIIDQTERMDRYKGRQIYKGEAIFCSEYGGIKWDVEDDEKAWGYGNAPKTQEEFFERYEGLTDAILKCPKIMGFCYTQLYDIEQERNGLYTYDRRPKFDMKKFKEINSRKAAIEE